VAQLEEQIQNLRREQPSALGDDELDFGRSTRRKRARFAYDARYGAEFRCCLGGAVT
jgi:hypothetical protein